MARIARQAQHAHTLADDPHFRHPIRVLRPRQVAGESALKMLLEIVADQTGFDLKHASEMVKSAIVQNPHLKKKLIKFATQGKGSADEVIRIIRIFECICSKPELLADLLRLESLNHPRIRSKVALTIGRLVQNAAWLREQLQDADPRVRANAIEALWEVRVEGGEKLLLEAALDSNNRVIGNAAYGLYKLGNLRSIPILHSLLRQSDKRFRSTGLWVATQTGDPRFLPSVEAVPTGHLEDEDEKRLRESAHQHLTARLKSSQFAGNLTLNLASFRTAANQTRTASFCCLSSKAGIWFGSSELSALNFVIEEGGKQIEEFGCSWSDPVQTISSAVIAPAALSLRGQPLRMLSDQANNSEALSIFSYFPSSAIVTRDNRNWLAENQAADLSSGVGPRRFSASNSFHEAVLRGLEMLSSSPGPRHLFVVVDSSCEGKLPSAVSKLARACGAVVHALVSEDAHDEMSQAISVLSQKSGGTFLRSDSADPLPAIAGSVRARRTGSCELSWRGSMEDYSDIKIRCISGCGYGELGIAKQQQE